MPPPLPSGRRHHQQLRGLLCDIPLSVRMNFRHCCCRGTHKVGCHWEEWNLWVGENSVSDTGVLTPAEPIGWGVVLSRMNVLVSGPLIHKSRSNPVNLYEGKNIRNVGIVGHGGSGKTSLISAILFDTGAVNRLGRVDDGNAPTDYDE